MNERIEKLAIECYQSPEFDYKKFAELIVRECARVASDRVMDVEGNDWGVRWAIKNHFGVEQ
jgi:hypothetical protein